MSRNSNWFTNMTADAGIEGQVFSNKSGLFAWVGNIISKPHDWWNSSFSKAFGLHGYDPVSGMLWQGGESYNTVFQAWSMAGMIPAAGFTAISMSSSAP